MKKLGLTSYSILLCVLLESSPIVAKQSNPWQPKKQPENKQETQLTITPSICVIKEKGEHCQQKVTIFFTSTKHHDICIYDVSHTEPLWCDKEIKQVSLDVTINVKSSLELVAKDRATDTVLASDTFSLSIFQPVKKRARRHYGIGIL